MHFERDPLRIIRANKQYVYDANGSQYIDCVNSVSHGNMVDYPLFLEKLITVDHE